MSWYCDTVCLLSCSVESNSATPWTVTQQAPLPMGFFRQEYWSGLPCHPPGDLPNPSNKPRSPTLQAVSLPSDLRIRIGSSGWRSCIWSKAHLLLSSRTSARSIRASSISHTLLLLKTALVYSSEKISHPVYFPV